MKYKNLELVGTSHISQQSIDDVLDAMNRFKPDIVAIELDRGRYAGLMSGKKPERKLSDIKKVGVKGYLFSALGGWAERKLADYTGVPLGSDMITAIKVAQDRRLKISLIDQDIAITLKRFSETLTWREKFRFLGDIVTSPFKRKKMKFDLKKVPSEKIIKELIGEVKVRYPNIYHVLITERNEVMAHNLFKLMNHYENEKILAVIGAGHEKEMVDLIKEKFKELEKKKSKAEKKN